MGEKKNIKEIVTLNQIDYNKNVLHGKCPAKDIFIAVWLSVIQKIFQNIFLIFDRCCFWE